MTMMTTKTWMSRALQGAAALVLAGGLQAAWAATDLAGGPAKNQLDLHPPITKIASEVQGLHYFMLIVCLVIFLAVFGVMFYSILKHRKSLGAKPANFHESVGVEIAWTIVPFIIVDGDGSSMATKTVVAHEGHQQCRPDHQGHRLPVEVGLRLPQGRGRRHQLPRHAGRQQSARTCPTPASPQGDNYLLKVDNPLVVPVGQEDPHHHHRQRRDPQPGWCRLRRQAGRHPRLRARHLVPRREDRRFLRPVRRAVRQGTRLHADPREGAVATPTTPSGWMPRRRKSPLPRRTIRAKVWETLVALVARGEKVYAANCAVCHQP